MTEERNYTVGFCRLKKAYTHGFSISPEGVLSLERGEGHFLVLGVFNSYRKGYAWGRLHFQAELPKGSICIVRGFAVEGEEAAQEINGYLLDNSGSYGEKKQYFIHLGELESVNHSDILLYKLAGQYLFLSLEILGEGEGCIKDMVLYNPGDNFMQTFPEIYQEPGGFFHRYMSVFSTFTLKWGRPWRGWKHILMLILPLILCSRIWPGGLG